MPRTPGKTTDLWAKIGLYTSLGFILPASALGGYLIGWGLDAWLHTAPVLSIVTTGLGAAGGIVEVLRILTRAEKNADGNNASGGPGAS